MKNFELDFTPVLGMTAKTQYAWDSLIKLDKVEDITKYLKDDFPIRTLNEVLERVITEKASKSGSSYDSIVKILKKKCGDTNVKNWQSGKAKALTKKSALKIAFALGMTYAETTCFLMQDCWLDGLYMRDYKDVVYRYCLDNKMDFEQAQAIIKKHSYLDDANPNVTMGSGNKIGVTNFLDKEVKAVSNLDELDLYLEQNRELFGTFRQKAYEKFMDLYNSMKVSPVGLSDDTPTGEEICDLVTMGIPSLKGKKTIINDVLKKIAKVALPRTTLSEIVGKQPIKRNGDGIGKITEVKRKHLILFSLYSYDPELADIDNIDKDITFKECIEDINDNLLEPCGMPWLDPRNPFDWVVMNAVRCAYFSDDDNNDSATDERINRIMALLFDRSGEDEDVTGY